MAEKRVGYVWEEKKAVFPTVYSAYDVASEHVQKIGAARHPAWVLDYTFTGHGMYRVKNPRMKLTERKPNTVHLYAPNTTYWEDTRKETGYFHSAWMIFRGGDQAGLRSLLGKYDYAQFFDPAERLGNILIEAANTGQKSGEYGYWRVQAQLCRMIHMLLNAEPLKTGDYLIQHEEKITHVSNFVGEVELYLRNNLTSRISLEEIADMMHVSVSALSHRFKRERGITPIALQHKMRIQYAAELLMRGYTLKEISEETGYSDEFHLSKMFKKVTGKSPREYRKMRK